MNGLMGGDGGKSDRSGGETDQTIATEGHRSSEIPVVLDHSDGEAP